MRSSNSSMECLDTHNNSNSHRAASNGRCTQIAVSSRCHLCHRLPLIDHLSVFPLYDSSLLGVSLPRHPHVCASARRLPMSKRGRHQVHCARRAGHQEWDATLHTWRNRLCSGRKSREEVCDVRVVRPTALPSSHFPWRTLHDAYSPYIPILLDDIQCV